MRSEGQTLEKLTAIIPLRLSGSVFEGEERFRAIVSTVPTDVFDVLVVDFGSAEREAGKIREICEGRDGVRVLRVEAADRAFSIGEARDIGVQHAETSIVMFHDVDFAAPPEMYRRIHAEAHGRRMDVNTYDFFCVPVLFLTEAGTEIYREEYSAGSAFELIYSWHSRVLESQHGFVENVAYGSSAIVANKHNYLAQGGHNRQFYGHGAEDYDLLHRLADTCKKGPRTAQYYEDQKTNEITRYAGFRPYFALYGIDVLQRGVFLWHLQHPRRRIPDYFQSRRNFEILRNVMVQFDRTGYRPDPIEDRRSDERTLLLLEPNTRSDHALRFAKPAMGQIHRVHENRFGDLGGVLRYVEDQAITRVGFLNPYGNRLRRHIYNGIREHGIPYWTFDRGALPDSWFFDPRGFNADSDSYSAAALPRELAPEDRAKVAGYIKELKLSGQTLERNGSRKGPEYWRQVLGLGNRKVIFVPLQRPNDTVIRYFAGDVGSAETFVSWINHLSQNLDPSRWAIVVKKHPLEKGVPPLENAYIVPDDANIYDLIELAEKVMLINSGTGVLSMAFDTPVITCGQTFYGMEGLNFAASSAEQALHLCESELAFDRDAAHRFLFHLIDGVYSFGNSTYDDRSDSAGAEIRLVRDIKFREIRGLGETRILGVPRKGPKLDSPLFYSFGGKQGIQDEAERNRNDGTDVVDRPAVPKVDAAIGSQTRGRGNRFQFASLLTSDDLVMGARSEAIGSMVDSLSDSSNFPVSLGRGNRWADPWNTRIEIGGDALHLSLVPYAAETDKARIGLLIRSVDDRDTLEPACNGAKIESTKIAQRLFLAHLELQSSADTRLTFDVPCAAAEIVSFNELRDLEGAPTQSIGPEHRGKIRAFTLNANAVLRDSSHAHTVAINNRTGRPLDAGGSGCKVQVRVKSEERKTFKAFAGDLPSVLLPGINLFPSGISIDLKALPEHEPRFVYTDVRMGSGEFLKAGIDINVTV